MGGNLPALEGTQKSPLVLLFFSIRRNSPAVSRICLKFSSAFNNLPLFNFSPGRTPHFPVRLALDMLMAAQLSDHNTPQAGDNRSLLHWAIAFWSALKHSITNWLWARLCKNAASAFFSALSI